MYLLAVALVPEADKMALELLSRTEYIRNTACAAGVTASYHSAELLVSEVDSVETGYLQWACYLHCIHNKCCQGHMRPASSGINSHQ